MYTIETTEEFNRWLKAIPDLKTRTRLVARIRKAEAGNLGDIRGVGFGVFEMREHFGPGWVDVLLDIGFSHHLYALRRR